ncbi:MAG: sugar nucleotide-binding protein [Planctomycetota bacterium]|nr:sugar nucleotide-binding protein [Planctomycetota bacterium]
MSFRTDGQRTRNPLPEYEAPTQGGECMNNVLIVGIEGAAGAGLAAVLRQSFSVVGLANCSGISIADCRIICSTSHDAASVQRHLQTERPDWIIFCGAASRSSWSCERAREAAIDDVAAVEWAKATAGTDICFTMISSDAVFTGPWMLHLEDDEHYCETPQAERLRQIELDVLEQNSEALVVRTNAFGWSPDSSVPEFAETLLDSLDGGMPIELDFLRHSSPILTTDLARMLVQAHAESLRGVLHISSSERINPYQFAERLAEKAGLASPEFPDQTILEGPVTGFGKGETTLDCSLAVELLGVRMPVIDDGIGQFLKQANDGTLETLRSPAEQISKVA